MIDHLHDEIGAMCAHKDKQLKRGKRKSEARSAQKPDAENSGKSAAQLLFQGQRNPKKMRKIAVLDQWVEVRIVDGNTVTELHPSNEKLIERGQRMLPPPELVYRRLNFPEGVPEDYYWAVSDPVARKYGGMGTQRMTTDTWLEVIAREKERGDGHIGPTGVGNLPRPEERGGCDCPVCSHNRAVLEGKAA